MDTEIDELKQEVEELKSLTQDTNRVVHKLRRNIWWGRLWTIIWWAVILGLTGASYLYLQPYIQKATAAYGNVKGFQLQVENFFAQFGHSSTTQP